MMFPRRRFGVRPRNAAMVDCAYCPTARRCWDEKPLPGTGFLVQPELRLERGASLTLPSGPSRIVFVVVSGCLTLRETAIDGTQHTAGFRLPGELVGLESWARADRPYEVRAATASVVRGSSIGPVRLPMTRADIGSYLGLSEETVVRALARLKQAHRLEVHGRMVGLCRPRGAQDTSQ